MSGGVWYCSGSLVEYAWTREYPSSFRRVVPGGLEDCSRWYRLRAELLPEMARLRGLGCSWREVTEYCSGRGVSFVRGQARLFCGVHGWSSLTDALSIKLRAFIDGLVSCGLIGESAAGVGWSPSTGEMFLNYLGLRPRRLLDLVELARRDERVVGFKDLIRYLCISSMTARRLVKGGYGLRELFAERRLLRKGELGLYWEERGVPLFLVRSSLYASVLFLLLGGAKTFNEVRHGLACGGGVSGGSLNVGVFRRLMDEGLVVRCRGDGPRRSYVYMLTLRGMEVSRRLLEEVGGLVGGVS